MVRYANPIIRIVETNCMFEMSVNSVRGECFANTKCEQNVSNHELKINLLLIRNYWS
jgi:hypothetical protein